MPKIKSHKGASKRFSANAQGRYKRKQSHRSHILTKKSTKRKRQLRSAAAIHASDSGLVSRMLPYS